MRSPLVIASAFLVLFLVAAQGGCASDPNIEGAKLDLKNKDYDRALTNVNTAIQKDPSNAEAYWWKGQILQEQAQNSQDVQMHAQLVSDMADAYEKAIELDPERADEVNQRLRIAYFAEFQRGAQAFNRGKEDAAAYDEAVGYFQAASALQPDSVDAYINQAYALLNAGRNDEAIVPFETAIGKGASDPDTYRFLADLYVAADRGPEAVTMLEKARTSFPENTDIEAQLLNAYIRSGQEDRAVEQYQQAIARDPENKLYRYNLGSLYLNAERYDDAVEQLAQAVRIDPEYGAAHYNLGAAYVNKAVDLNQKIGELDDALRADRSTLSADQIKAREAEIDALAQQRRGFFQQAITPLERARDLMQAEGSETTQVCQALFQSYVQTGQTQKAEGVSDCAGY